MPYFSEARLSRRDAVSPSAFGLPANLPDHTGQLAAAQPFLQRKQRILGTFRRRHGSAGERSSAGRPGTMGAAAEPDRGLVLHPQESPSRSSALHPVAEECQRQPAAATRPSFAGAKIFVHGGRQAAPAASAKRQRGHHP